MEPYFSLLNPAAESSDTSPKKISMIQIVIQIRVSQNYISFVPVPIPNPKLQKRAAVICCYGSIPVSIFNQKS